MTVTCQSPRVINQDSSCTATLDDDSPGTKSPPAGSVSWSRAGAGAGTFTGAPCTLAPSDADSSTCSVTYSPTSGAGTHTITGSYGPNALHESNSDDFDITVNKRATVMTVTCQSPRVINQDSSCTATLDDDSPGTKSPPAGSVSWSRAGAGAGTFTGAPCTLAPSDADSSTCSVTYSPTSGAGTHTITGSYGPNALHESNSDDFDITVNKRATVMTVTCQSPRVINQDSSCTATLDDDSPGTKSPPAGSVSWSRAGAGAGTFTGAPCTLAPSDADSSTCSVTYSPTSGAGTHTITGSYGPNALHESNSDDFDITVNKRATVMTVTCQSPRVINQDSSCTATLDDDSPGTKSPPAGSVSWSRAGAARAPSPAPPAPSPRATPTARPARSPTRRRRGRARTRSPAATARTRCTSPTRTTSTSRSTSGATSMTVTCQSPRVINQDSSCTATLDDDSPGTKSPPAGSVSCSRAGAGAGTFTGAPCTLAPSDADSSTCSVTYSPTSGAGTHTITGSYGPNALHESNSDDFDITVNKRATVMTVTCQSPRVINQDSSCTATLDDDSPGTKSPPAGSVSWSRAGAGAGTFTGAPCTLAPSDADSSTCSVTYSPTSGAGTHTITGSYGPNALHESNSDDFDITVNKRATVMTVTCQSPRVINQDSSCTATLDDDSPGTKSPPAGSVSWSRAGAGTGTFTGAPCTLAPSDADSSTCSVTYSPTSGAGTHTITGSYGPNALHESNSDDFDITVNKRATSTASQLPPRFSSREPDDDMHRDGE